MSAPKPRNMCLFLDAGSSGTRLYVYGWKSWSEGDPSPPQIEELYNVKQGPGIAKLFTGLQEENLNMLKAQTETLDNYLNSLFSHGRTFCAGASIDSTSVPLFLLATAGMRVLKRDQPIFYDALLARIKVFTQEKSSFLVKECGSITGEAEALYGWIAANYSLGFFAGYGMRAAQTVGYVELGGASAQIAYNLQMKADTDTAKAAKASKTAAVLAEQDLETAQEGLEKAKKENADNTWEKDKLAAEVNAAQDESMVARKIAEASALVNDRNNSGGLDEYNGRLAKVKIGTLEFDLFLGSYTVGSDIAREKYDRYLQTKVVDNVIQDPCKHKGWSSGINPKIEGSARFDEVKRILATHIQPTFTYPAHERPDRNVVQSANRSFVGGANFWYNTRQVFGLDGYGQAKTTPFSFGEYEDEVKLSYQLGWDLAKERRKIKPSFLEVSGFNAAWVQHILFKCFGFKGNDPTVTHEDKLTFRPYNGSNGVELSWTLGRVILFSVGDSKPQQMTGEQARTLGHLRSELERYKKMWLRFQERGHDMKLLYKQFNLEEESLGGQEELFAKVKTKVNESKVAFDTTEEAFKKEFVALSPEQKFFILL
ncbi:nucleoside phosphatase family-domain-containing protein [Collybia nuda]|uniref:Nucleoside phosphatase family-domain-containing protein n=1 Tax=Collybia nuda TaxID=64659 RepID=A0A9P5XX71_9AGAR|nr:nucleoside phosphatase family-domain-containing protein [Collybia nuda]